MVFEDISDKDLNEDLDMDSDAEGMEVPKSEFERNISSLHFKDGIRSVDFVLVWKKLVEDSEAHLEEQRNKRRNIFELNLEKVGLQLEKETLEEEITFVKVSDRKRLLKTVFLIFTISLSRFTLRLKC